MSKKWRSSEDAKQKRRKVLPGFPWEGKFQTKEEVDAYFAGDKIQCLLCGKWYKEITFGHLSRIHDTTVDEYRERYGLPWRRGMTGQNTHRTRSQIAKQLIAEGKLKLIYKNIRQKEPGRPRRPLQPFARNAKRKQALAAAHKRPAEWQRADYEAILTRMQEQQRSLSNVLQDPDLPGETAWRNFVKQHPDFAEKAQQIHFSLPYSKQLRSHNVSPQFQIDCQRLRSQGKTLQDIAKILGVSSSSVRQALPVIKLVRKRLTLNEMRQLAERRGGKCLSQVYINNKTKLLWECAQGHQWEASPFSVKVKGHWCPLCGRLKQAAARRLDIEEMHQLAKHHGGKCLSKEYVNVNTKLLWECEQGHQWEARPSDIKRGQWCPYCAGIIKGTLEDMQQLATRRGGKCLSKEYINTDTKLLWECKQGHQWTATPSGIKRGNWCPYCAGTVKLTIEDMQQIAERRGGRCLSPTYINTRTELLWQCAQGHQWETTPKSIMRGTWCPHCAGRKKSTIQEMQQIAKRRGGYCLSTTYKTRRTKLIWQCAQGHLWKATPHSIMHGSWCPHCTGVRKGTIEEMQRIAEGRGGRCLSPAYTNSKTKLVWQCAQEHQWEATPSNIKRGHWCPHCARSKRKGTREKN